LNRIFILFLILLFSFPEIKSQTSQPERYIQVSGIITDEQWVPVPGVVVISRRLHKGTASERTGIYSITSAPGDTIYFRALGFKRYHTIIPADYTEKNAKVDIFLEIDTISIAEVTILPWRSYNEFLKDMSKERKIDPMIVNMNENIASIYVAIANQTNVRVSPEAGYKYAMEQNFSSMATRNQYPMNNLLNPFAWAKFISGVKNGMLKNQKFNKPTPSKVRKKIKTSDSK